MMNALHDIYYNIGFDELSGNFQNINYSGEGLGNDPVVVINLKNDLNGKKEIAYNRRFYTGGAMAFGTPVDGQHPILYMDNLDYATNNHGLIHEYTHGVYGRTAQRSEHGECQNYSSYYGEKTEDESGPICEGYSEFFASSLAYKDRKNKWTFGHLWRYTNESLGQGRSSIKQSGYDRMEFFAGALNDAMFLICGENNAVKGFKCDKNLMQEFKLVAKRNLPYNVVLFQIALDAISRIPCRPNFESWRNAIFDAVAHHRVTYNSRHFKCLLWVSFANRGFGANATEEYTKTYSPRSGILFEQYENNFDLPEECLFTDDGKTDSTYTNILSKVRMNYEDFNYSIAYERYIKGELAKINSKN